MILHCRIISSTHMFWNFQQVLLFGKGVHLSSVLVFEGLSTLLCAKSFWWWKVFLLKNIAKDLVGFSSLVEKGFPRYFLCSCAWCFFLWSWLLQHYCLWLSEMKNGIKFMLNLAYKKLTWYQSRIEENHCTLQIEGKVCCSVELKRVKPLIEKSMVVNKVGPLVTNMW